jgi:uncharacterized membrane protein YfcA
MGMPTVAMGLLGLLMSPGEAAALLVVPATVTNVWQLWDGPAFRPLLRRLWPLLVGICLGTWAGAGALSGANAGHATMALGLALAAYALLGLSPWRLEAPPRHAFWLSPLVGFTTGLITAATGVFVIPAVPYIQALRLDREDLIQALGLSFTVSTLALAGNLVRDGAFDHLATIGASLLALAPALIGLAIGTALRRRIPPGPFRVWFFLGLLGLGLHLALRNLL